MGRSFSNASYVQVLLFVGKLRQGESECAGLQGRMGRIASHKACSAAHVCCGSCIVTSAQCVCIQGWMACRGQIPKKKITPKLTRKERKRGQNVQQHVVREWFVQLRDVETLQLTGLASAALSVAAEHVDKVNKALMGCVAASCSAALLVFKSG